MKDDPTWRCIKSDPPPIDVPVQMCCAGWPTENVKTGVLTTHGGADPPEVELCHAYDNSHSYMTHWRPIPPIPKRAK